MLKGIVERLESVGKYIAFLGELFRTVFMRPFRPGHYIAEIELLGVNSILIILLSSGAIGAIFALQIVMLMQMFQAEVGVGAAVAITMARELAPIITTLMLIAKNGSAMAAELGTMRVTEQIDALESMSVNPVHYLVLPKVVASMVVFPILTLLANIVGTIGSYVVAIFLYSIDSANYLDYMFNILNPRDIGVGMIKSVVMAFITATICCYHGLNTTQGARGVGDSATRAVVAASVAILVADYVLSSLMLEVIPL
jgi:phospholipid/cholesterol/gamma-HCH transport system permease protein